MTPLVRGPQSFFSLFRPSRLLSRRMFCDSSSKPVLLPKACGTEKATKNKRTRDVVYIYILGKQTNKPIDLLAEMFGHQKGKQTHKPVNFIGGNVWTSTRKTNTRTC